MSLEVYKDIGSVGVLAAVAGMLFKWVLGRLTASLDQITSGIKELANAHASWEVRNLDKQDQIIEKLDDMTQFIKRKETSQNHG